MPYVLEQAGFDFDGVIADIGEAFLRLAATDYGYTTFKLEDITDFHVENCLPIPSQVIDTIFSDILEDSLATGLKPMAGAVDGLNRMAEQGPITVITARALAQPVYDWFDHYFPQQTTDRLRVIVTGDHDDKMRHLVAENITCFIDDRAETCTRLSDNEIFAFVYSQPWNIGRHRCPSIDNWTELVQLFMIQNQ